MTGEVLTKCTEESCTDHYEINKNDKLITYAELKQVGAPQTPPPKKTKKKCSVSFPVLSIVLDITHKQVVDIFWADDSKVTFSLV